MKVLQKKMKKINWRRSVLKLLFWLDKTDINRHLKELDSLQFLPREKLLSFQKSELEKILKHSYEHVPYYRELFEKHHLIKDGRVDLAVFSQLPSLTKEIIRCEGERLWSKEKGSRRWYRNTSGGSTGVPVEFIQDNHYRDRSWANKILYSRMVGKEEGEKEIKLWGSERDIFQGGETWRVRLQNWLYNRRLLNSFKMSKEQMTEYVKVINQFKPVSIWAYVDSVYELACWIEKSKLKIFPPRLLLVTAGTVYPEVKKYISKIFEAPVYNQYGSREAGDMACECPHQTGLHVFEYLYYFEILNQSLEPVKPGEIGEIYVTSLINYSMPLIRYRIGDTASWTGQVSCSCGRNLALINDVHGRITDHFRRSDGTLVHGEYFTHLFYFRPWVKKFQVRQKAYEYVECLVVKENEVPKEELEEIRRKVKLVMGENCRVDFNFPVAIEPSGSGKYLYTITEIKQ